jgi:hypothetical protein
MYLSANGGASVLPVGATGGAKGQSGGPVSKMYAVAKTGGHTLN